MTNLIKATIAFIFFFTLGESVIKYFLKKTLIGKLIKTIFVTLFRILKFGKFTTIKTAHITKAVAKRFKSVIPTVNEDTSDKEKIEKPNIIKDDYIDILDSNYIEDSLNKQLESIAK